MYNFSEVKEMTLGEKIVVLRKKLNLTQEKLSERIGVSRQTLSNWESDITSPDIKQAIELSKIFKISLDELVSNQVEVQSKKTLLTNLIGETCYLDINDEDLMVDLYDIEYKIVDINNEYIKVEYQDKKDTIIKLIDMDLVDSIKVIKKVQE